MGPRRPAPMVIRSIERIGVISAAVPLKKTSSAMYNSSRGMMLSTTGMPASRSEEHTSELQSLRHLVCRLLLEKKKQQTTHSNLREGHGRSVHSRSCAP